MKKENIFWLGFSDLMTSLFFIMFVLFIISFGYLKYNLEATKKELNKIKELQTAVQTLPKNHFEYQPQYKRFKLKEQIHFKTYSSTIDNRYYPKLIDIGNSIKKLIDSLNTNTSKIRQFDIKYLLVIEGMSSNDNYSQNFELSYQRALSLYRFWKSKGIIFDPKDCEVQISGSGTEGIREYNGDEEYKNQQFLIHIIPKMGKIENNED